MSADGRARGSQPGALREGTQQRWALLPVLIHPDGPTHSHLPRGLTRVLSGPRSCPEPWLAFTHRRPTRGLRCFSGHPGPFPTRAVPTDWSAHKGQRVDWARTEDVVLYSPRRCYWTSLSKGVVPPGMCYCRERTSLIPHKRPKS